jgi:eukaryotic-like serine/threonine-protein kinase
MQRSPASPPVLAGYDFIRVLGSGGFSDVFLYDQKFPKRRVAVKVLLAEGLTAETRDAFVAEANLMARLSAHPYIVTILQADVADDGRPYFVMEYCSGPSLSDRYKQERFSVADTLQIGIRLASAVATAHSVGVLHRDIKPANVLTNDFGWPALTDFGISSTLDDAVQTETTMNVRALDGASGATTGSASVGMSIPWSPPEMFDDIPDPSVQSDVFSLAATIYTILAGRTPFEVAGRSNASVDLIGRIVRGSVAPLDREDVPSSLTAVLHKGMATERRDRFASSIEFARALQRVELELSYAQTPIDVPNLSVRAPERPKRGTEQGPDPDATRARSITTVHAQSQSQPVITGAPVQPIATPGPRSTGSSPQALAAPAGAMQHGAATPVADATVVRPRHQPEVTDDLPSPTARRPHRAAVMLSLAGVAVLVIGGVMGINAWAPTAPDSGTHKTSNAVGNGEDAVGGSVVPSPVLVAAITDAAGTSVNFSWQNPDGQSGDIFLWQRTNGTADDQQVQSTQEPTAVVRGVTPGEKVCIKVDIRRQNGETSANPLEACYPS